MNKTEEILSEDEITNAFDNWADDTCIFNEFYNCSNKQNKENECFKWNCPIIENFYESDYYKDLLKEN